MFDWYSHYLPPLPDNVYYMDDYPHLKNKHVDCFKAISDFYRLPKIKAKKLVELMKREAHNQRVIAKYHNKPENPQGA